jgi:hypothetical protein
MSDDLRAGITVAVFVVVIAVVIAIAATFNTTDDRRVRAEREAVRVAACERLNDHDRLVCLVAVGSKP